MTPRDFTYWLHGYTEIHGETPSKNQWKIILNHLDLALNKSKNDSEIQARAAKIDLSNIGKITYC